MEGQERETAVTELRALMGRGRLLVTPHNKDLIAKALAPLPPPWEWRDLREQIELDASGMARRAGVSGSRVRFWEAGGGTMYPEHWVEYAIRLLEIREEVLREKEQASLLRSAERVPVSEAVAEHQRALRTACMSVVAWMGQDNPCTPVEAEQFSVSLREAIRALRITQRKVQRLAHRKETEA